MAGQSRYTKTYACTKCETEVDDRNKLTVKKVSFHGMGARAKTFRSRVIAWLCPTCLKNDPDWNREAYKDPAEASPTVNADQLTIPAT